MRRETLPSLEQVVFLTQRELEALQALGVEPGENLLWDFESTSFRYAFVDHLSDEVWAAVSTLLACADEKDKWALNLYGSPLLFTPKHTVVFKNVGGIR